MEEVKVKIETNNDKVVILTGEFEHPKKPLAIKLSGTIDAVLRFLEKRKDEINLKTAHVLISRENFEINLFFNESNPETFSHIKGEIEETNDFKKFKINTGQSWEPVTLSQFIKMNRGCFESKETAMALYLKLRDFQAKVNGECTKKAGASNESYEILKRNAVDHNLPGGFALYVPIFKGTDKKVINVEIEVNPDSLQCYLISPDANDEIALFKDSVIDEQKTAIAELCPDLVIIEQ